MHDQPFPWRSIVPLSLTVMVAFGIMLYGFSVFLTDQAAGSEFSTTVLSIAYGGGVLAGGLLAFPVGRRADRHGVRGVFGTGALLGFAGLVAFSLSTEPWHVLGAWWLLIGPAGAMTFYEPAFVAVDRWCSSEHRPRALAILTLVGGLAGIIFIPGVERLVAALGWRQAVRVLAGLLLLVGGGTALVALRGERRSDGSDHREETFSVRALLRDLRFVLYTAGVVLSFVGAQGVLSHRIARFEETGFVVAEVAAWAAVASALSLPGRSLAPFVARRIRPTKVQAAIGAVLTAAVLLMVSGTAPWQMMGHFTLFGLAFGAFLPLRAMVMGDWYSGARFGRTMGVQWTMAALAGAAGPSVVGVLHDTTHDYRTSMIVLVGVLAAAAVLILMSGRVGTSEGRESAPHHVRRRRY